MGILNGHTLIKADRDCCLPSTGGCVKPRLQVSYGNLSRCPLLSIGNVTSFLDLSVKNDI